jgi:nicotinamidase-related amidase
VPIGLAEVLSGEPRAARRAPAELPAAVVTMEVQRGVVGDLAFSPDLAGAADNVDLVAHTIAVAEAARAAGLPVVHCTAEFRPDGAGTVATTPMHTALLRRPGHLEVGSPAAELVPGLFAEGDLVSARRHGVSPFGGTGLDALLRGLSVRSLVVCGVSLNVGVTGLCIEAVNLGYRCAVPTDTVAGFPGDYAAQMLEHTVGLVATLTTSEEVVATIGRLRPR